MPIVGTASHYDDATLSNVMAGAILPGVITDMQAIAQCGVLIENCAAYTALPPDDAIVQNNGVLDNRSAMNLDTSPEHRVPNYSARENTSIGNDGTNSLGRTTLLIKTEFRTRVGIAGRSYRPTPIV